VCLLALGLPIAPPEADLPVLPPAGAASARLGVLGATRPGRSPAAGAEAGGANARRRRRADEDADFAAGTSTGEDEGEDEGLGAPAGGAPEEEEGDSCLEAAKSRSAPPPAVPASLRAGELVAQLRGLACMGSRHTGQPTALVRSGVAQVVHPVAGRARSACAASSARGRSDGGLRARQAPGAARSQRAARRRPRARSRRSRVGS
jgi:hypothetical protein